jgi:nitroreductase
MKNGGPTMSILSTIKKRRSIREYLPKKITPEIIEDIKEALIWAPSAGNLQARKFFFIYSQKIKDRLAAAALNQSFIAQAPLVIVACTDGDIQNHYGKRGLHLYTIQDVAASLMGMMLLVHEEGLGSVWIGAFNEKEVSRIIGLPGNLRPVAIVPVGYPASVPTAPERVTKEYAISEI